MIMTENENREAQTELDSAKTNKEETNTESGLERKGRRMNRLMWILLLIESVGTSVVLKFLPETIPMHFNAAGKVDRYGSKYELIVPLAFSLFSAIVLHGRIKIYKEKADAAENAHDKAAALTGRYAAAAGGVVIMLVFLGVLAALTISGRKTWTSVDEKKFIDLFSMFSNLLIALMMIVFGNIMPKSRRNGMFGVRTSWSNYNDKTWAGSNRIGGKICVITGILSIPVALFVNYRYSSYIILGMLLVMAAIVTIVSYRVYVKVKEQEEKPENR